MSKVLERELGSWEYVMLLVITICVVYLVMKEKGYYGREGIGASHDTVLSGLGQDDLRLKAPKSEGYEQPVFWNSGDYSSVDKQQQSDVRREGLMVPYDTRHVEPMTAGVRHLPVGDVY